MENKKKIKEKNYTIDDMKKALNAIKAGHTITSAAKQFNVPYTTLLSRHTGFYSLDVTKGPQTVLTPNEEERLVNWMITLSERGFPVKKNQLLDSVKIICNKTKRKTPFINNRPSNKWFKSFMNRHKELSLRTSQNLSKRRSNITEANIRFWFAEDFGLQNDKECLTALITMSGHGDFSPVLVLFKAAKVPPTVASSFPNNFVAGATENGWMTAESFYEYMVNHFYPWCVQKKIVFPIVVYLDGHSSHLTFPLSEFCAEKQIELIALYPNATHILQPLDVAFFRPFIKAYKQAVANWREGHHGLPLKKENFCDVLFDALKAVDPFTIMQNGFKCCGLHPFSANAVDYSRLLNRQVDEETEKQTAPSSEATQPIKEFFEKNIEPQVLATFEKCAATGIWEGQESAKELYKLWLKAGNCPIDTSIPNEPVMVNSSSTSLPNIDNIETIADNEVIVSENESTEVVGADLHHNQVVNSSNLNLMDFNTIPMIVLPPDHTIDAPSLQEVLNAPTEIEVMSPTQSAESALPLLLSNDSSLDLTLNLVNEKSVDLSNESQVQNPENNQPQKPDDVFEDYLFWPQANKKTGTRKKKEHLPSVVSGPDWIAYQKAKQEEKEQVLLKKEAAKLLREQKKLEKENEKKIKQEQVQEKKRQRAVLEKEKEGAKRKKKEEKEKNLKKNSQALKRTSNIPRKALSLNNK